MTSTSTISRLLSFLNRSDGSLSRRILRSGVFIIVSTGVGNLLTLVRQVALARLLFPEAFGVMSICAIVLRGVNMFTEMGLAPALIHRQENFEDAKDTAFTMGVLRGLLLAAVLFLIAPFIAGFYSEQNLTIYLRVISLALLMEGLQNINIVALQKRLDFKRIAILNQSVAAMSTIVIIFLAWYFRSVWALVIGKVFTASAQMVFSYVVLPGGIKFGFDRKIARELFSYGKFITGLGILLFIVTEMDNLVIGKILGMEMLGYYVVAFLLADLPVSYISKVASRLMFPAYAELQNRMEPLREAYLLTVSLVSAITVPAAFGLMILAPEIIGLVYGEKWLPAVAPLQFLAFFGACRSINALNGYLLNGIGRPNVNFYIACLRIAILPVLLVVFTRQWGITGAAAAVLIPIAIHLLLSLLAIKHILRVSLRKIFAILAKWTAYSAAMAAILFAAKDVLEYSIPSLIILVFLGISIYTLLSGRTLLLLLRRARVIT